MTKKEKVAKVMSEFYKQELHSSSGEVVKNPKQAIAIALSEAGLSKKHKSGGALSEHKTFYVPVIIDKNDRWEIVGHPSESKSEAQSKLTKIPRGSVGKVINRDEVLEHWSTRGREYLKDGGNIDNENALMVANNNKQIAHHTKEMQEVLKKDHNVPAWVVAKVNRSASDLSDATHYMAGKDDKYKTGGTLGSFYNKAKSLGQKGVDATKKAIHDKQKNIALDVLWETKENLAKGNERKATEMAYSVVENRYAKGGKVESWIDCYKKPLKIADVSEFLNSTKDDGHEYSLWNKEVGITFAYNGRLYINNGKRPPYGTTIDLAKVMSYWESKNIDTLLVDDEKLVVLPEKQDKYDCYTTGYDGRKNSYGNEYNLTLEQAVEFCWYYTDVKNEYKTKENLEKEIKSTPYGKENVIASSGNITGVVVYKSPTMEYAKGGTVYKNKEDGTTYSVEKNSKGLWTVFGELDGEYERRDEFPEAFESKEDAILVAKSMAGLIPEFAKGGELIKRADGSYSKRGLWDNIRDNVGSGKNPTKQMLEQEAKIKAESMRDGGLIAPNGAKSNLTPKQYKLVRTPEFKAWFGDWENDSKNASKIVDENGEPLVVYHGTKKRFNIFDNKKLGSNTKNWLEGYNAKLGFFFTTKKYATLFNKHMNPSGVLIPAFLNIKSPIKLFTKALLEDKTQAVQIYNIIMGMFKEPINRLPNKDQAIKEIARVIREQPVLFEEMTQYNELITKNGFDGAISEFGDEFSGIYEYIAFKPEQIKLADGSNTTFDSENPDIRFAKGGIINPLEKELRHLQRDLNSDRLGTYIEGDTSEEELARKKEREVKLARFNEVLELLRANNSPGFAKGGNITGAKGGSIDKVSMNVPFLIRALEYSKEEAPDDIDLHKKVESIVNASQEGKTLEMKDYNTIFADGGKIDTSIPKEIYNQIGSKAFYMLGAKNIVALSNYTLAFRIRGSKKVNYVKVTLNSLDLYDVEYGKIHASKYKVVSEDKGIYNDMLLKSIERNTGLYTRLFGKGGNITPKFALYEHIYKETPNGTILGKIMEVIDNGSDIEYYVFYNYPKHDLVREQEADLYSTSDND